MTSKALIRAEALDGWAEILEDRGLNFRLLSRGLNKNIKKNEMGHDAIILSEFVEFLERASSESHTPGLAWSAGHTANYATRGVLGRAVLSSKTVGGAFRTLTNYFPLLQEATDLKLSVSEDWATLSYRILDPDIWPRHSDAMYSLGIYSNLFKQAAPDAWSQSEITVEATPEHVDGNIPSVIQANCVFDGETNSLRFPSRALDCKLAVIPSFTNSKKLLDKELVKLIRSAPIVQRVRCAIFKELSEGSVGQEHISKTLGMTSRTMRRRLAKENLSFQAILDDCRMRTAALEFRMQKNDSLSEMALRLGYSEHSTFSRAFTRWAGMPPQDYRKLLQLN